MKKKRISLTNQILLASAIGLVVGAIVGPVITPIKVVGDVFLRLIQMGVPVIIFGAVAEAVGGINPKDLGKLGLKIFTWFLIPTLLAAAFGLGLAYLIKPGVGLPPMELNDSIQPVEQTLSDIILNFFPTNIIDSMAKGSMIQVIVFALFFGASASIYGAQTGDTRIIDMLKVINKVVLGVVKIVMVIAPIGVFALMAWVSGSLGLQVVIPLAKYLIAIIIAVLMIMVISILFAAAYTKVNPVKLAQKLTDMTLVAFATTSSAISLPTKMADSENKLGVSKRISGLVNPLGMVLNSTGQAVFLSIAAVTIAQFFNIEMPFTQMVQVVVLSTLACMGTLAVPGGALVILAGLLPSLGLPLEGLAIIAGVDWFRGMFTTIPNVDGDALVAMIIAKSEGELYREVFDGTMTAEEAEAAHAKSLAH